ncbi:hypothetical protein [Methanosarcina sp. WH1]|uniref:hypothetical protein n=1 Tax=Methanosarcina sp. WH1 TaxID=1434102 RepID=UPI0006160E1A|nr:hypothetical protein [Methanosarcina sp. WH1]AKB22316.1 hypothetical protein MSWH1_2045 [Methanosarcina sp. WH1]
MNRKHIVLVLVLILGVTLALGCTESSEDSDVAVESETLQTGEAQVMKEETTTSAEITSTSTASKYQDTEWINSCDDNLDVINSDLDNLGNASLNSDIHNIWTYGTALRIATQIAIDDSKLYSVSPSLQPIKEKYELTLNELYQAGYYAAEGAYNYNNGKLEQASEDFELSTSYLNLATSHFQEINNDINNYNSK